ncbi:uncharacterized protein [Nicotiana sylvestris]|uniref:uncharacterized protein n=1 Tax=Nicotiana sylvestris TaxID=4096 RepID=UPI00388C7047
MPDTPKYNGITDPHEHVTSYTYAIKGNDLEDDEIESILLKKFGEILSKGAMIWYHNLPPNSIDSFAMLADSFIKAHAGVIKVATRKLDLFKVRYRDNEMLREFVSQFQIDHMELPSVIDDWVVQAFTQGLNEQSSKASCQLKLNLIEYPVVTWADVHNRYVSAIGRIKDTRWPRLIQIDLSQRNPNLMCKYHGTHGHRTEDYRKLREEVARLFNEGHLREFLSDRAKNNFRERDANKKIEQEYPQHVIHMIVKGVDIPQGHVFKRTKVLIIREKLTPDYVPECTVSFNDEEAEGISQPHNDVLVTSILLNKVQVKRALVDPGSSANIIRSTVVEQLGLQDQIVPATRVLNGFNIASETTKGEIVLPVNVAGIIQDTKFHVYADDPSARGTTSFGLIPMAIHEMGDGYRRPSAIGYK